MKQILGTAVIASALSVGAIDAANANNIETTTSEKQTVCNTDTIVKNARNRTFGLIEGWETGKNRLTYCRQGQLMMSAPTATGKKQSFWFIQKQSRPSSCYAKCGSGGAWNLCSRGKGV